MKLKLFSVCLFLVVYTNAQTFITPDQAKDYVGKEVAVCGKLFNTHISKNGTNFLNFGAAYPN